MCVTVYDGSPQLLPCAQSEDNDESIMSIALEQHNLDSSPRAPHHNPPPKPNTAAFQDQQQVPARKFAVECWCLPYLRYCPKHTHPQALSEQDQRVEMTQSHGGGGQAALAMGDGKGKHAAAEAKQDDHDHDDDHNNDDDDDDDDAPGNPFLSWMEVTTTPGHLLPLSSL